MICHSPDTLGIATGLCFAVGVSILLFGFVSFDRLIRIESLEASGGGLVFQWNGNANPFLS